MFSMFRFTRYENQNMSRSEVVLQQTIIAHTHPNLYDVIDVSCPYLGPILGIKSNTNDMTHSFVCCAKKLNHRIHTQDNKDLCNSANDAYVHGEK